MDYAVKLALVLAVPSTLLAVAALIIAIRAHNIAKGNGRNSGKS